MAILRKEYILKGLCCRNCAAKIQKDVASLDAVRSASVNPDTTILSVEYDENYPNLLTDITKIAVSHDEDIEMIEKALIEE